MKRPRLTNGWSRVTSVLSDLNAAWKEHWFRKNGFETCDRIRDTSSEFGRNVHKIVESYLLGAGILEGFTAKEEKWAVAIINWLAEQGAVLVYLDKAPLLEYEVKDSKLRLIGHLDAVFEIKGQKYLTDFKTTGEHRKEFPIQKAVYAKLLKNYGVDVNKGLTIKVSMQQDTPEVDPAWYENLKPYWKIFLGGYRYYQNVTGKVKVV